jgi:hypothetical protein
MNNASRKHGGKRKGAGRPITTGTYPSKPIRFPPTLSSAVEAWAKKQADKPTFSEAIRRLVAKALNWHS